MRLHIKTPKKHKTKTNKREDERQAKNEKPTKQTQDKTKFIVLNQENVFHAPSCFAFSLVFPHPTAAAKR
jgi:hypothetical protein